MCVKECTGDWEHVDMSVCKIQDRLELEKETFVCFCSIINTHNYNNNIRILYIYLSFFFTLEWVGCVDCNNPGSERMC